MLTWWLPGCFARRMKITSEYDREKPNSQIILSLASCVYPEGG